MKTTFLAILLAFTSTFLSAQNTWQGFSFQTDAPEPDGTEWQSPERLSLGKQLPHAYFFHFADAEAALQVLPGDSKYYRTLDGTWKFHWSADPEGRAKGFADPAFDVTGWDDIQVPGCWNVQGLGQHGEMKYGVPIYVNQPVIFYHEVKEGDWKQGVMREPKDQRWTTYKYRNEVGSYRRSFTVPKEWIGRRVYINFDGVDSFFYLWINGRYVGFSKNSRNTARFDISHYLIGGENTVAVEVYRSSDGSFLESQDMFRLPGIIRSTYLTAIPEMQIRDLKVRTDALRQGEAAISVRASLSNLTKKEHQKGLRLRYSVYPVRLYQDATGEKVLDHVTDYWDLDIRRGVDHEATSMLTIKDPNPWSAEQPNRYVLVAELQNKKGRTIDCVSTYFGVCQVEIRDTEAKDDEFGLAGRYFYVNGQPVKLKGVNRHETNPTTGHAITHEQMTEEVMLMKRGNINHIRTSHYSNDPYMYYLCDKYGIYLEDECNLESHEYYYGKESLSHPKEWLAAHVARNMEMVRSHVNHPSIVIWSLGNEAGPGDNFKAAYLAIKDYDRSSVKGGARPVQYERNNNIVDMGSNQYPSVDWVRYAVKGTDKGIKYPYHISEYAHSMGNSLGNLADYWEAIESTNFFCGGAIWDWVDQAIDTYTPDGKKYMGYGGDHGDWPNDGMFCMNGIMLPDLTPKPQYYEVKKVYQNAGIKADWEHNAVTVFNKNYFTTLSDYQITWTLMLDGKPQKSGEFIATRDVHGPRMSKSYRLPFNIDELPASGEYFLNVELTLGKDMPWAKKGYVQMAEQLPCTFDEYDTAMPSTEGKGLEIKSEEGRTVISTLLGGDGGRSFRISLDDEQGCIHSLAYDGRTVIEPGNGPKLDAFRAPVDNDNWAWNQWFQLGLYDLQHKATDKPLISKDADGAVSILYNVRSQAKSKGRAVHRPGKAGEPFESIQTGQPMTEDDFHFTTAICYTIYPDGTISVASSIVSSDPAVALPRLGYAMKLPKQYDQYCYYGRGPLNNYADRRTGSFVGLYKSTVKDQFVNFPKPQSMGNREEVRWCALTDGQGNGLQFIANSRQGDKGMVMSTSALPWSALQMTLAAHPHELPQSDGNYLHLDCQVTGLGGNSCGQGGPLDPDRVKGALHQFKFIIRPTVAGEDLSEKGKMWDKVESPVTIVRDRAGKLSIIGDSNVQDPSAIFYTITNGKKTSKPQQYHAASPGVGIINLRDGGTVTAWYEGNEKMKTTVTFPRIENVPVEVVYVSSEEGPGGDLAKNLTDGDPSTIWHTMYSITVPKYPHWVDFDCGEEKLMKGFTYLPRQDGSPNGTIKGYKVQLSDDGKTWGEPVAEGEFEAGSKEKKVLFKQPAKARYLRFTALSSQNGGDYASGAEFMVMAE